MIILLNGSINAGKSSVSKILCRRLPRTAHVEVDDLRAFVAWMPLEESIPLNVENAAAVTKVFVAHGVNVVLSYPLRPADYDYLLREFAPLGVEVHCVTLRPRLEVSQRNRGTRELTAWEVERIKYHYETALPNPTVGVIIDNSEQPPDETADTIIGLLESRAAGVACGVL